MTDQVKDIVESVIQSEYEISTVQNQDRGITFEQIQNMTWRRLIANAVVELINEDKIRCINGKLYVPVKE